MHPAPRTSTNPVILKFEGPGAVTCSFWYDPSYWNDGLRGHFNVHRQIQQFLRLFGLTPKILVNSGSSAGQLAQRWLPLWAGVIVLGILGMRGRKVYGVVKPNLWLLIWPLFAFVVFASVLVEYRYVFPFAVLVWITLFITAWVIVGTERALGVTLTVTAGLLLMYAPDLARQALNARAGSQRSNQAVAKRLESLGIRRGDELASVDFPLGGYYARLVGARFTQEILGGDREVMARTPAADVQRILATLRANGAKALVASWRPAFDNDTGWTTLSENEYIRLLE